MYNQADLLNVKRHTLSVTYGCGCGDCQTLLPGVPRVYGTGRLYCRHTKERVHGYLIGLHMTCGCCFAGYISYFHCYLMDRMFSISRRFLLYQQLLWLRTSFVPRLVSPVDLVQARMNPVIYFCQVTSKLPSAYVKLCGCVRSKTFIYVVRHPTYIPLCCALCFVVFLAHIAFPTHILQFLFGRPLFRRIGGCYSSNCFGSHS